MVTAPPLTPRPWLSFEVDLLPTDGNASNPSPPGEVCGSESPVPGVSGQGQQTDSEQGQRTPTVRNPNRIPEPIAGEAILARRRQCKGGSRAPQVPCLGMVWRLTLSPMRGEVKVTQYVDCKAGGGSRRCDGYRRAVRHCRQVGIVCGVVLIHQILQPLLNCTITLISRISWHGGGRYDVRGRIQSDGQRLRRSGRAQQGAQEDSDSRSAPLWGWCSCFHRFLKVIIGLFVDLLEKKHLSCRWKAAFPVGN